MSSTRAGGRCRSPGRDPRGARRPRIAAKGPRAASYGACNRCKVVESYTSWSCGQDSRPGPNATGGAACATRREAGGMVLPVGAGGVFLLALSHWSADVVRVFRGLPEPATLAATLTHALTAGPAISRP